MCNIGVPVVSMWNLFFNTWRYKGYRLGFVWHLIKWALNEKGLQMQVENLVARSGTWEEMRANFQWPTPARYNIAEQICERWARAEPDRHAMTYMDSDGGLQNFSYQQLSRLSSQLANTLRAKGLQRGCRDAS